MAVFKYWIGIHFSPLWLLARPFLIIFTQEAIPPLEQHQRWTGPHRCKLISAAVSLRSLTQRYCTLSSKVRPYTAHELDWVGQREVRYGYTPATNHRRRGLPVSFWLSRWCLSLIALVSMCNINQHNISIDVYSDGCLRKTPTLLYHAVSA